MSAIKDMKDPAVVPGLLEALRDSDEHLRLAAANGLRDLAESGFRAVQHPGVAAALTEGLKDPDRDVRWTAQQALRLMTKG